MSVGAGDYFRAVRSTEYGCTPVGTFWGTLMETAIEIGMEQGRTSSPLQWELMIIIIITMINGNMEVGDKPNHKLS